MPRAHGLVRAMADRTRRRQLAEPKHRAPGECPVCGETLLTIRLGCPGCGTEIVGEFDACEFCALDDAELHLLRLFLAARGNLKEVEKHLGVSYPTARLRLTGLLAKLGLSGEADEDPGLTAEQVLKEVAQGALTPIEGARLIESLG
ncbi:DUF2089 domain-containing protein [Aestuariimicrobium sp. T2.26MG-19.2B]|uniref:DUF2089 domain-containing protein n=1 Tax=Aestuariimicrobium sp. T2.26MG-19.2B TaxID=3040679 RepID=UPI0024773ECC|nr:DUF2089 domain-containing protein [Aestuariimicrobium sp. T2.26MG-19.2B]CAI9400552.1 hypothetical protein AESSP_00411 [Aestuariimicrobium sp. T2.26MG-19.2B]